MTTMLKERKKLLNIVKKLEVESLRKVNIFIAGMEAGKTIVSKLPASNPAQGAQAGAVQTVR